MAAPLTLLAWVRLRRLLARFASLVASVEAGRLPAARHRKTPAGPSPRPAFAPALRLPGGSGWLLLLAPALEARLGRAQVESLLGDPALAALLAQAPQAGRILRPLCHMLAIGLPPALRLARRPQPRRTPGESGGVTAQAERGEPSTAQAGRPKLPPWLSLPASPPLPSLEKRPALSAPRRRQDRSTHRLTGGPPPRQSFEARRLAAGKEIPYVEP